MGSVSNMMIADEKSRAKWGELQRVVAEVNWLADELVGFCGYCHEKVWVDVVYDDDFWRRIAPDDLRLGVLCPQCVHDFAEAKGEKSLDFIKLVYLSTPAGTMPLIPAQHIQEILHG